MSQEVELIIRRFAAYIVDVVLLFIVLAPTVLFVETVFDFQPATNRQVWIAAVMSFSIPAWSYFLLSDLSRNGMTVGKKLLKIKVTLVTLNSLSFSRALLRTAIKLLPWELAHIFGFALADSISQPAQSAGLVAANFLIFIYLIILVFTAGKKSLHDVIAKTNVIMSKMEAP